jgi:hypothetical protein
MLSVTEPPAELFQLEPRARLMTSPGPNVRLLTGPSVFHGALADVPLFPSLPLLLFT